MTSHHHCCHHSAALSPSYYCAKQCCYTPAPYTGCFHHPPPPVPDSNLSFTAVAQPPRPHLYSVESHLPNLYRHQYQPQIQERYVEEEQRFHPTVSSLLRRIASLESTLRRCSPPYSSSHSLREAAARTIQAHFRAYLLRRSRTLRQLKDLASIKSTLRVLKSSVSEKTHFDHGLVYHESVNLLLKLDSIQGCDPMIRDGRKSVSRELNQFLDFIDVICVERKELPSHMRRGELDVRSRVLGSERKFSNAKHGTLKGVGVKVEKLRNLVAKIDKLAEELDEEEDEAIECQNVFVSRKQEGFSGSRNGSLVKQHGRSQHRAAKSVSFAENGKVYRVLKRNQEPILVEDFDDVIERGTLDVEKGLNHDDICHDNKIIGISLNAENENEDEQSESGGSLASSDGERVTVIQNSSVNRRFDESETKCDVYAAPLPMKMETRVDLLGKRRK